MPETFDSINQAWESLADVHRKAGCPEDLLEQFKRFFYSGVNVTRYMISKARDRDRIRQTGNTVLDTKLTAMEKEFEQYLLDWQKQLAEENANAQDNEPQPPPLAS